MLAPVQSRALNQAHLLQQVIVDEYHLAMLYSTKLIAVSALIELKAMK